MLLKLRARLTFANVMSCIAVFIALGGTAYAAATITSADIADGQVKSVDLGDAAVLERKLAGGAVTSDKVRDNNLRGRDVLNDTLTGDDINESSLTVGSLRGPPGPAGPAGSALGFAHIDDGGLDPAQSKGVLGVTHPSTDRPTDFQTYCFDLSFVPKNAVATLEFGSSASDVAVVVDGAILGCPEGSLDAAVFTYTNPGTFYVSFN